MCKVGATFGLNRRPRLAGTASQGGVTATPGPIFSPTAILQSRVQPSLGRTHVARCLAASRRGRMYSTGVLPPMRPEPRLTTEMGLTHKCTGKCADGHLRAPSSHRVVERPESCFLLARILFRIRDERKRCPEV